MKQLDKVYSRIVKICGNEKKSYNAYMASLIEETGELAEAFKIHHKIVKHKKLDEPLENEAVDVFICLLSIMTQLGVKEYPFKFPDKTLHMLYEKEHRKDKFLIISILVILNGRVAPTRSFIKTTLEFDFDRKSAIEAGIRSCLFIWFNYYKNEEAYSDKSFNQFMKTVNTKLDKWENNQATLLEIKTSNDLEKEILKKIKR